MLLTYMLFTLRCCRLIYIYCCTMLMTYILLLVVYSTMLLTYIYVLLYDVTDSYIIDSAKPRRS